MSAPGHGRSIRESPSPGLDPYPRRWPLQQHLAAEAIAFCRASPGRCADGAGWLDKAGILRYHGALDSARDEPKPAEPVNYVVNAVQQLSGGETVAPYYIKPYGCSVKYKR